MLESKFKRTALVTGLGMALLGTAALIQIPGQSESGSVIIQGSDLPGVTAAVQSVGGEITHELGIINAVGSVNRSNSYRSINPSIRAQAEDNASAFTSTAHNLTNRPTTSALDCSHLTAEPLMNIGADKIEWKVFNDGDVDLYLDSVMVLWPVVNGYLMEVKFGDALFDGARDGVSATFVRSEWGIDDDKAKLKSGGDGKIEVKFEEDATEDQLGYKLRLFFNDGCSIDFPPPPEVLFSGDSDTKAKRSFISTLVGADDLRWEGIDGNGIGMTVIDTGVRGDKTE